MRISSVAGGVDPYAAWRVWEQYGKQLQGAVNQYDAYQPYGKPANKDGVSGIAAKSNATTPTSAAPLQGVLRWDTRPVDPVYPRMQQATDSGSFLNPSTILQRLDVAANKFSLINRLKRGDWMKLLGMLPKDLLVNGLRLFDKEQLLKLINYLPKEWLVKMLMSTTSISKLVKKMPIRELMRILKSRRVDNHTLTRGLNNLEPKYAQLVMTRIYGDQQFDQMKPYDFNKKFLYTPKRALMDEFKRLPYKALVPFVTGFIKNDPKLLMEMSEDFIAKQFEAMSKAGLIMACSILPEDKLIDMLEQLPDKMLAEVANQIDDNAFSGYMLSQQSNLLYQLSTSVGGK